jgi:hypothetical protein
MPNDYADNFSTGARWQRPIGERMQYILPEACIGGYLLFRAVRGNKA